MRLTFLTVASLAGVLLSPLPLAAASHALWIQPSGNFLGIDGNWSSFSFGVGEPAQHVELSVSTALSEIWAIGTGGCSAAELCKTARGGLFDVSSSSSWEPLGPWELGLADLGMGGNGDYGLESVAFANTLKQTSTAIGAALVAAINDTDYYQGFIGVGVTQSRFGKNVTNPLIPQLAQTYGTIPSHTYGYTAGAHYRNMPASLTLGGYDTLRLADNMVEFHLDQNTRIPSVNLRAISATLSPDGPNASLPLLTTNESLPAVIDTSTPYLWLPRVVCDRFAKAFDLTWNETLGVYLFDPNGDRFADFQKPDSPVSFTFSLSSYDNVDNYGNPLELPGIVNITVTSAAFAQLLRYPFRDAISFDQSSVPYFPLKRANEGGPLVIGRAFMQEAYLFMNYDRGRFSLHQALFPQSPDTNYSLATVERPPDSPYPAYVDRSGGGTGLSTGQTAGIVVGAFAMGSVIGLALWYCCRRRRAAKRRQRQIDDDKQGSESGESDLPKSPVKRMLSMIIGRKRSRKPTIHEVHGSSAQPVEVGADANHQVYELPVPPSPVELDGNTDEGYDAELVGADGAHGMSQYEVARIKLEKQLLGPLPEYSPPSNEKTEQDVSSVPHYRPEDDPSPASSPTYANSNSLPYSLPSPLSPHTDGTNATRNFDLPSPITATSNFSGSTFDPAHAPSSLSRSTSSNQSAGSPTVSIGPPSPVYQRAPIDPSRIVCLGPLPENVQLPNQRPSIPQLITTDPRTPAAPPPPPPPPPPPQPSSVSPVHSVSSHSLRGDDRRLSSDTLGSNFTVEEENRMRHEMSRQTSTIAEHEDDSPHSPNSMGRIDAGSELIHVPQLAERRYSWEEDHQ